MSLKFYIGRDYLYHSVYANFMTANCNSLPFTFTAATPKKKFKFKFDESLFNSQGNSRAPRCSLPALDFHGLKLPSRSRISLPAVASSIKYHISKNLPARRASLAAIELHVQKTKKQTNGDVRRRTVQSDDLGTMHEEEFDEDDSPSISRETSASADVFSGSRVSVADSLDSERNVGSSFSRQNSEDTGDENIDMDKTKSFAKRRHSESTLYKHRMTHSLYDSTEIISYRSPCGKTISKPQCAQNMPALESVQDDIKVNSENSSNDESTVTMVDEIWNASKPARSITHSCSSNAILQGTGSLRPVTTHNDCGSTASLTRHCNGAATNCNGKI